MSNQDRSSSNRSREGYQDYFDDAVLVTEQQQGANVQICYPEKHLISCAMFFWITNLHICSLLLLSNYDRTIKNILVAFS